MLWTCRIDKDKAGTITMTELTFAQDAGMFGMPPMQMPEMKMPEIPKIPGMDKFPEMPKMPGQKSAKEKVADMDDETKTKELLAASERVQNAEWEDEIPVPVAQDLEMMFAILDKDGIGAITLSTWTSEGLKEDAFYKIDKVFI